MSSRQEALGADNLRVRENGEWGKEKLEFLSQFGPVALKATEQKRTRHYVDLFAGPGMNRVRRGTSEFEGSPIRALELCAPDEPATHFTDAWFVNRDRRDCAALQARVDARIATGRCRIERDHVRVIRGDANEEVRRIFEDIHPRSYVFVFADMEAPRQFPWSSVEALKHGGHESVDLYLLFPLDMALMRMISRNPATREASAAVLTSFFGTEEWRDLIPLRILNSEGARAELGRRALGLYLRQLRTLWLDADEVLDVRRGMRHRLYKMLFATSSAAGRKISRWARGRASAQPELF